MSKNRKQHFSAQFYLRNFAEPMFSNNIWVYFLQERRWDKRSPKGVGWHPHLCTVIDMVGNRTDEFDRLLRQEVEEPATPVLKRMAKGEAPNATERAAVALFMALTVARSPEMMQGVLSQHRENLSPGARQEQDDDIRTWCALTGQNNDENASLEYHKPGLFRAMWRMCQRTQARLLAGEWHFVHTTRDKPFVTSDWPVYAEYDEQGRAMVAFPVSSEVALIVAYGFQFGLRPDVVRAINSLTMTKAKRFVVAWKQDFPGDDALKQTER
jgi:hypothetical protein